MAVNINIQQNLDAFARLRVSNPQTLFDSKQLADLQPLFWDDQQTSGGGTSSTYNTNQASTSLNVGASTAGVRVRQTFRRFNYQSGKSQLFILTAVLGLSQPGIKRKIGQFDEKNGFIFDQNEDGMGVTLRSFTSGVAVDNRVSQADWNLDKMDGTGESGVTLDYSKTLIFFCDYEWLGVGTARFGVYIDGRPIYVHAFHNSNINTLVYLSNPNLPIRYEIENDGTGSEASLLHICSTVITEGGRQETGVIRGLNRATNTLTTLDNTNIYPLIGLRLKSTNLGAFIRFIDQQIICTTTSEYAWYLILKPTIVGVTPSWIPLENASIEYSFPANTTTVTEGTILATGIASDTSGGPSGGIKIGAAKNIESDLVIGSNIAGVSDELFLCVQRLTGTTETFYSSINFSDTF
jgi:hypothetical protein